MVLERSLVSYVRPDTSTGRIRACGTIQIQINKEVGMRYDVSCTCILVQIFFHRAVNTNVYLDIFQEFVNPLDDRGLTLGYLHQNGAMSHALHRTLEGIKSSFSDRFISK
jgi:hypothetical protein